ncbi:MAG: hypothetical protein IJ506_02700 [Clostridia bacterium]|nr:hypothetical protein [Clostridia bacterium]
MSRLDLLKFLERYGDETDISDYSPDELQELIERMKNGDEPVPLTKEQFKRRYFAYYDDVKDKSLKKQDW